MNRLASEASPYLRQHGDNPVDWYPWCPEAFERARQEQLPVMLSVGYSSCHWCHVMAHESFEDPEIAATLNKRFVCVKVDREERPDIDAVYMEAVQAMSGHGGWPMTVFLTPDGRPFFAGTYFPPQSRGGMPGFTEVLRAVDDAWRTRRGELDGQADRLVGIIRRQAGSRSGEPLSARPIEQAVSTLKASYDRRWGGFGAAPKFPQASAHELLLRHHARNADDESCEIVSTSLHSMAAGGIYDHLGGGFARYSVDATWLVPHFEKMLYDQAALTRLYVHAWQVTGDPQLLQVAEETVSYVLRDLGSPEGGLFSAEDADSEGVEGGFYLWRADQVRSVLGPDASTAALEWYGVRDEGNFEGSNILHRPERGKLARPPGIEAARAALFEARATRPRPGLDDKVLTEWNAMFCAALAEAAAATHRQDWAERAAAIGQFLVENLRGPGGRWMRSWRAGSSRHLAYAVDYAWLVEAFVRLRELSGHQRWLDLAEETASDMLGIFWDGEAGGLFTTGEDAERLIVRSKELFDGSTPSANSVACLALARLAALTGKDLYRQRAEEILEALGEPLRRHPASVAQALGALDLLVNGTTEIVVTGDRPDLVATVHERYLPDGVLGWGEPLAGSPLWSGRAPDRAYVCRGYTCRSPADSPAALAGELDAR